MLELLQPKPGDKILDIGSGSVWQTALLAYCVSRPPAGGGKVFAIERIPELVEFGKKNVAKYNFVEKEIVKFTKGDGSKGLKKESPFDKIIVAAAAEEMPRELKDQLKINGRLVIPIKSSIWLFIKKSDTEFEEIEFPGFAFVPLIEE